MLDYGSVYLVYGQLCTGGIETLIVRLVNYLTGLDKNIHLFIAPGGTLEKLINGKAKIYKYSSLEDLKASAKIAMSHGIQGSALIISFDPSSAARAEAIRHAFPRGITADHKTGVFHPLAYFMDGQPGDRIFLNKLLAFSLGFENLFFMNEECRASHSLRWNVSLAQSAIIPIPILRKQANWKSRAHSLIKIVSVGRLVDFKRYNSGAPVIISECLGKGLDIYWDIFGSGPLSEEIVECAKKQDVSSRLSLLGSLEYKDFTSQLCSYDLFIGMGTSALEASMLGLPTICAAVGEENKSYGFISDLPFGNVGEHIEGRAMSSISSLIQSFSLMNTLQRQALSQKCVEMAHQYSMDAFVASFPSAKALKTSRVKRLIRFLGSTLFLSFTEGLIAKKLFGRGIKRKIFHFVHNCRKS